MVEQAVAVQDFLFDERWALKVIFFHCRANGDVSGVL